MATIYCFTSTGNSLFTARKLAEKIGADVKPMNSRTVQCADDVIGFVVPVYFWGLPRIVERFVSDLQISNKDAYVFAVTTSGGQASGILGRVKKLLAKKGIPLQYGMNILSASDYIPEYLPKDTEELRQRIDRCISEIASAVNSRQINSIKAYTPINWIAYRFYPKESCDKDFTVAPACTGCGTCQKVCPVKNIVIKDGQPDFQHKCEHCLACLHHCPAQAIDWKHKTQGKPRFKNAGVSLGDLISFHSRGAFKKE